MWMAHRQGTGLHILPHTVHEQLYILMKHMYIYVIYHNITCHVCIYYICKYIYIHMFELVQYKHNIDIANNLDLCVPTIQKSHSFQQKPAEVQLLGF